MQITKSSFLLHQSCSTHFWFAHHNPDVLKSKPLDSFAQQLIDQGVEVEAKARKLFPEGELITTFGAAAVQATKDKIKEGTKTIFQATFTGDDLHTMCDVIKWNPKLKAWDIYEVKGTTSKDKKRSDHYWDVAFQREVLEGAGEQVGKLFLIELNKEYIKSGEIDVNELFTISDITEEIDTMRVEIQIMIGNAKATLAISEQPIDCDCLYKSVKHHCAVFDYLYPNIPEYSIYNITRIGSSPKKLRLMVDADVFELKDIPEEIKLTENQQNQVFVHNVNMEIFKEVELENELKHLKFPLYFLDYETIPTAIPLYDNCHPFQQVPFQYSLHIKDTPTSKYRHKEFLHLEKSNPIPALAKQLRADIGDTGSVIVWNKSFESMCNNDMAKQVPELADFLHGVNLRIYDLMDIFTKQLYVRKEFLGKTSIKYILPALAPRLSYKHLNIQEGGVASSTYKQMIWEDSTELDRDKTAKDLLDYCELDTLAMAVILDHVERRQMEKRAKY